MRIIEATTRGMCFGVRDALEIAFGREDAEDITLWGELVHNEVVLAELGARGFAMTPEDAREGVPETPKVLITAHGVSDAERRRLQDAGKELIDTTCPLVRHVHAAARRLEREGYEVVVIGKPGHVEVRGIVGDLGRYRVISSVEDVERWDTEKIGVVCQSTVRVATARAILAEIARRHPTAELRTIDTICDPTKQRVLALETLLLEANAIVVVGGKNSNNTRQLVRLCVERGVAAFHVQGPDDLDAAWFEGCEIVGLTAGTSTLDHTIAAVHDALDRITESLPS